MGSERGDDKNSAVEEFHVQFQGWEKLGALVQKLLVLSRVEEKFPGDFLIPTGPEHGSGCESSEGVPPREGIPLMWSALAIGRERELIKLRIVLREAGDGHLELSQGCHGLSCPSTLCPVLLWAPR